MKQTFITLGEGLTDLFEFMTMIEYNHQRIDKIIYFHSPQSENKKSSVAIIMNPTTGNHFQAFYIMINAIKYPYPDSNKKFQMINDCAEKIRHTYFRYRCTAPSSISWFIVIL